MDEKTALEQRHSVRQFTDKAIDADTVKDLQDEVDKVNRESGLTIQLEVNETEAFQAGQTSYGNFSGCRNYFVLTGPKGRKERRNGPKGKKAPPKGPGAGAQPLPPPPQKKKKQKKTKKPKKKTTQEHPPPPRKNQGGPTKKKKEIRGQLKKRRGTGTGREERSTPPAAGDQQTEKPPFNRKGERDRPKREPVPQKRPSRGLERHPRGRLREGTGSLGLIQSQRLKIEEHRERAGAKSPGSS